MCRRSRSSLNDGIELNPVGVDNSRNHMSTPLELRLVPPRVLADVLCRVRQRRAKPAQRDMSFGRYYVLQEPRMWKELLASRVELRRKRYAWSHRWLRIWHSFRDCDESRVEDGAARPAGSVEQAETYDDTIIQLTGIMTESGDASRSRCSWESVHVTWTGPARMESTGLRYPLYS